MKITLDKLEEDILENLKEETGKSEEDIIKLALYEFNRRMVEDKAQKMQPVAVPYPVPQAPYVPVNPVYPDPFIPTYPQPWDTKPYYPEPFGPSPWNIPYRNPTWTSAKLKVTDSSEGN